MCTGRVEEAGAPAFQIGRDITRRSKRQLHRINGKTDVKELSTAVRMNQLPSIAADVLNRCQKVRRLQSHTVLRAPADPAGSSLGDGRAETGVNPSPVRRSSQSAPRAGGVQQSSHDDRPEDALR